MAEDDDKKYSFITDMYNHATSPEVIASDAEQEMEAEFGIEEEEPPAETPEATADRKIDVGGKAHQTMMQANSEAQNMALRSLSGAMLDLVEGAGNLAVDLGNDMRKGMKDMGIPESAMMPKFYETEEFTFADNIKSKSIEEQALRKTLQYVVPYGAVYNSMSKGSKFAQFSKAALTAGAIDAAVIDPEEANLSKLTQDMPIVGALLPDFLASNEDDSRGKARFKNFVEAVYVDSVLGAGALAVGKAFSKTMGVVKKNRVQKEINELVNKGPEAAKKEMEAMGFDVSDLEAGGIPDSGPGLKVNESGLVESAEVPQIPWDDIPTSEGSEFAKLKVLPNRDSEVSFQKAIHASIQDFKTITVKQSQSMGDAGSKMFNNMSDETFQQLGLLNESIAKANSNKMLFSSESQSKLTEILTQIGKDTDLINNINVVKTGTGSNKEITLTNQVIRKSLTSLNRRSRQLNTILKKELADPDTFMHGGLGGVGGGGGGKPPKPGDKAGAGGNIGTVIRKTATPDEIRQAKLVKKMSEEKRKVFEKNIADGKRFFSTPKFKDVNLDKVSNAMTIDEMDKALGLYKEDSMSKLLMDIARGGDKVPQEITIKNALKITKDQDEMTKILAKRWGKAPEELKALQMITQREGMNVLNAMPKDLAFPTKAEVASFAHAMQRYGAVTSSFASGKAGTGRALNILNDSSHVIDKSPEWMNQYMEDMIHLAGGQEDITFVMRYMDKMMKKGQNVSVAMDKFIGRGRMAKIADGFQSYYLSNLLSAPKTQVVSLLGNGLRAVSNLTEAGVTESLGVFDFTGRNLARGETAAHFQGMFAGMIEGVSESKEFMLGRIKGKDMKFHAGKRLVSAERFGMATDQDAFGMGNFVNLFGNVISPTAMLHSGDLFMRNIAKHARMRQLAIRELNAMGFVRGTDAYAKNYDKLVKDPLPSMLSAAEKEAASSVFMAPYSDNPIAAVDGVFNIGQAAQSADDFLRNTPMGRVFAPFVRITANMAEFKAQRIPGLGFLNPKMRSDFMAGGARRYEALAKQTVGAGVLGMTGYLSYQGFITGSQPGRHKTMKAVTGDSRYADNVIWDGDGNLYKYDRFDPFGSFIGIGADLAEMSGYITNEEDEERYLKLVGEASIIMGNAFTPEFITQGMADFINFIKDPTQYKGRFPGLGTGLFPGGALFKSLRKEEDQVKRDTRIPVKDINSAWDRLMTEFQDHIPGLSNSLPPMRNMFGDRVMYPPGVGPDIVSPYFMHEMPKADMGLMAEIARLNPGAALLMPDKDYGDGNFASIAMPPRTVNVNNLAGSPISPGDQASMKLSPEQYERLVLFSAGHWADAYNKTAEEGLSPLLEQFDITDIKVGTLKDTMKEIVGSKAYKTSEDPIKRYILGTVVGTYQSIGRRLFLATDSQAGDKIENLKVDIMGIGDRFQKKQEKLEETGEEKFLDIK